LLFRAESYGLEALVLRSGELSNSRRFILREAAVRWADEQRTDIERGWIDYLAAIPPPDIGAGSDNATFYAACRLVRGFSLSASAAESLLWEWAGNRPGWTRDWIAQKVSNAETFGDEPIGALR
jgi:hypothetical protein